MSKSPTPPFGSYAPIVHLQGTTPVAISLSMADFSIDWNQVASAINSKTRMIIINSPHNPTGAIFTSVDIERLTALTRDTDIVILSDEVYEHVAFGLRKGDTATKEKLNVAIAKIKQDRVVETLSKKYFGDIDVTVK